MKHRRKIITTGALWSEKLASIDHAAERLYWRIYMASDNYGVMSGKAWDVCQQAAPGVAGYNRDTVQRAIDSLVAIGLLERWEVDGSEFVHVIGHDTHQSSDFIRKRGVRRSPMPPSGAAMKKAGSDAQGDERDVYLVEARGTGRAKIGVAGDVSKRLPQLATGSSQPLELLAVWKGGGAKGEREFMSAFADRKIRHEWFQLDAEMVTWMQAKGSGEGQPTAPRAEVCPSEPGSPPITTTSTTTTTSTEVSQQHRESEAAGPIRGASLPPNPRSVDGQIRECQRIVQSHASQVVIGMIARYNESRERMLTPQQELDRFWKPAAELRSEHGAQRLREAMNECGRVQATSINYAATICGRLASDAAKATTNPDAQPGAFDYLGDDAA